MQHDLASRDQNLDFNIQGFMVFNTTFKNISVISWRSVLLVEENGVPGENHDYFNIHNSAKSLTANIPYSFLVFKREEWGDTNSKAKCLRVWWGLGFHYWLIPSTFWCVSSQDLDFQHHMSWSFFECSIIWREEVVVFFVGIH